MTFIIDYAKEHGLTVLLNPILASPNVRERFAENFKELSWNNYRYRYSVTRDAAYEIETSVIFAAQSFVPRSVRFNVTLHMFGMSINFVDATLRVEGMTDVLRAIVIDKLTSEEFLASLLEKPEQFVDMLKAIADKLKLQSEDACVSLALRVYGADVFYSELRGSAQIKKLTDVLRSPRDYLLYAQTYTIKNFLLIDSRVRQPLSNGLEFATFFDISAGLFLSKKSTKTDSADARDFSIRNFYG